MKKILSYVAVALTAICLTSSVATATISTCAVNDNVLAAGYACTLGGLTFSNFGSNTTNPQGIDIGAVSPGNPVGISFNPNLPYGTPPNTQFDTYLVFEVTGGITGVSLAVNGVSGAGVNENVCSIEQGLMAINLGTCSAGHVIASTFSASPGNPGSATFALAQTAWIFKDINSGVGTLSEVDQGYTTSSTVPEPMTLSMMGVGLLGLGLISRRKKS